MIARTDKIKILIASIVLLTLTLYVSYFASALTLPPPPSSPPALDNLSAEMNQTLQQTEQTKTSDINIQTPGTTGGNTSSSRIFLIVILIVVILALAVGIIFLIRYLKKKQEEHNLSISQLND